jgi:hypothetical protein
VHHSCSLRERRITADPFPYPRVCVVLPAAAASAGAGAGGADHVRDARAGPRAHVLGLHTLLRLPRHQGVHRTGNNRLPPLPQSTRVYTMAAAQRPHEPSNPADPALTTPQSLFTADMQSRADPPPPPAPCPALSLSVTARAGPAVDPAGGRARPHGHRPVGRGSPARPRPLPLPRRRLHVS